MEKKQEFKSPIIPSPKSNGMMGRFVGKQLKKGKADKIPLAGGV